MTDGTPSAIYWQKKEILKKKGKNCRREKSHGNISIFKIFGKYSVLERSLTKVLELFRTWKASQKSKPVLKKHWDMNEISLFTNVFLCYLHLYCSAYDFPMQKLKDKWAYFTNHPFNLFYKLENQINRFASFAE